MIADENEPKRKRAYQIGQDLSDISVDDLEALIAELENEIERLKTDAKAKNASKSAADAFFKI